MNCEQAVTSDAIARLAAETSASWRELLNFMRIFRQEVEVPASEKTVEKSTSKADFLDTAEETLWQRTGKFRPALPFPLLPDAALAAAPRSVP